MTEDYNSRNKALENGRIQTGGNFTESAWIAEVSW